eukprot:gene14664-20699_t
MGILGDIRGLFKKTGKPRQKVLPSYPGRYVRALCEEQDARLGICFACKKTIGRTPGRKEKKNCTGCKRVAYCSK